MVHFSFRSVFFVLLHNVVSTSGEVHMSYQWMSSILICFEVAGLPTEGMCVIFL